jgi:hypothetical protein
MKMFRFAMFIMAAVVFSALGAPAQAQATRTWVSGVGDDVNPCSRTAPCKTFAGAISKTAAGGEINCLDPGGFGAVTITKSMTISCPYTEGGNLAGGNGIVVNLPAATDVVFLRGLDIFGVNPPSNGVRFIGQGTLHIEDCTIRRFNAANSAGVSVATTGPAKLYITNSTISENGNAATGGGVDIKPTSASNVQAVLRNVRLRNNANNALRFDSTTTTGTVVVLVEDSEMSGSAQGIAAVGPSVAAFRSVGMVRGTVVFNNTSFGIVANGTSTRVRVANTAITNNGTGVSPATGSSIQNHGGNLLLGNTTDGLFN